jgi:hypothetical protein
LSELLTAVLVAAAAAALERLAVRLARTVWTALSER